MSKILLIGNGAREHVIAETLLKSSKVEVVCFGNAANPGISKLATAYQTGSLDELDAICNFARDQKVDYAICGPEAPLAAGITDKLQEVNIPAVGPNKLLAKLESSKSFARDLLSQNAILGNPRYQVFFEEKGMKQFMEKLGGEFVVKADGLKSGKGVKVSGDHLKDIDEGLTYARSCLAESGRVVIEEKLIGQEFSLMSFCDGKSVIDLPAVQDHKRAFERDQGPNTGGMGSYSAANHLMPFLRPEDVADAHNISQQVANSLYASSGQFFKGILYGGFIATKNGVRLIEYNVRFGDPEAMNVLPILKTDFDEICRAIINGSLSQINIEFEKKATVCKYAVPKGYPDNPIKGAKIEIGEISDQIKVYFASVDERPDGLYLMGSRAVAVVGIAENIVNAEHAAEEAIQKISGPLFHRADIGTESLIQQKIEMMKKIRGES